MSIDVNKILKTVDVYISQVDSLLNKSYKEGEEEKKELFNNVASFILTVFPDENERLSNLIKSFPISVANFNYKETEESKQMNYISYLKTMRNNLASNREELQVKFSPEKRTNELEEINKEKHEEPVETTRTQAIKEVLTVNKEALASNREELQVKFSPEKNVISKEARQLGTVTGIEIDTSKWKVTHLRIALIDKLLQPFGFTLLKTPSTKNVEILIPTETVEIITDFIVLNKTIEELKGVIGQGQ